MTAVFVHLIWVSAITMMFVTFMILLYLKDTGDKRLARKNLKLDHKERMARLEAERINADRLGCAEGMWTWTETTTTPKPSRDSKSSKPVDDQSA